MFLRVLTPFYFAFIWYPALLFCNLFLYSSYPRFLISPPFFVVCLYGLLSFCYTVDAFSDRTNNFFLEYAKEEQIIHQHNYRSGSGSGTVPSAEYFFYESLGCLVLCSLAFMLSFEQANGMSRIFNLYMPTLLDVILYQFAILCFVLIHLHTYKIAPHIQCQCKQLKKLWTPVMNLWDRGSMNHSWPSCIYIFTWTSSWHKEIVSLYLNMGLILVPSCGCMNLCFLFVSRTLDIL